MNQQSGHRRNYVERRAQTLVQEALSDTRVVAIQGARQVGKSTLAEHVAAAHHNAAFMRLDDPVILKSATEDPINFLDHEGLMVIDEVQYVPDLFRPLKLAVDADPTPGRFLLTGSSGILSLKNLPDTLPGRLELINLWPLSQGEIDQVNENFIDRAFAQGPNLQHNTDATKKDYLQRIVRGGFPDAIYRTERRRAAFFESYVTTLVDRDVSQLSMIEQKGELRRMLNALAGRCCSVLQPSALGDQLMLSRPTITRYLKLLEAVFLIHMIPAWTSSSTTRAMRTPKLAFVDTGIACHLIGQDATHLNQPGGAAGPLMENFVAMEIARQLPWSDQRAELFHYRTKDKTEVDIILESPNGEVVAIEVKAGANVRGEDLSGLRHLSSRLGERLLAGYVLYSGQRTIPLGERIRAVPIDVLWAPTH